MRAIHRVATVAAATGLLLPGQAPAHADVTGLPCRIVSSSETAMPDPTLYNAVVAAGPYAVTTTGSYVSIACWVQLDDATYRWPWGTWPLTSTTEGSAGYLAGVYSYNAAATSAVYLCTRVGYKDAAGHHVVYVDEDPATPGKQCRLLTPVVTEHGIQRIG